MIALLFGDPGSELGVVVAISMVLQGHFGVTFRSIFYNCPATAIDPLDTDCSQGADDVPGRSRKMPLSRPDFIHDSLGKPRRLSVKSRSIKPSNPNTFWHLFQPAIHKPISGLLLPAKKSLWGDWIPSCNKKSL